MSWAYKYKVNDHMNVVEHGSSVSFFCAPFFWQL